MCTRRLVEDFELELEWRHLRAGGNSGVFAESPDRIFITQFRHPLPRIVSAYH